MENGNFALKLSGSSQCQATTEAGILAVTLLDCAIVLEYSTKKG
jgi:hypothetical protein